MDNKDLLSQAITDFEDYEDAVLMAGVMAGFGLVTKLNTVNALTDERVERLKQWASKAVKITGFNPVLGAWRFGFKRGVISALEQDSRPVETPITYWIAALDSDASSDVLDSVVLYNGINIPRCK